MREFEIGDRLIIARPSYYCDDKKITKFSAECSHVFSDGMILVRYQSFINKNDITAIFDCNGKSVDGHDKVVLIRKPRHGSKEARDIVAMLGRYQHKHLLNMLKIWVSLDDEIQEIDSRISDYWATRKSGGFNEHNATYLHFMRAKSMLQVQ